MSDLIQQLKDNEKPFGLMTAPLQEEAGSIGIKEFWVYCEFGQTELNSPPVWGKHPQRFNWGETFCLRPDYAEKPKVVECEVSPPDSNGQMWVQREENHTMDFGSCVGHKDFIGFKYEADGGVIAAYARGYMRKDNGYVYYGIKIKDIDDYEVLTPTHVLFKGATK